MYSFGYIATLEPGYWNDEFQEMFFLRGLGFAARPRFGVRVRFGMGLRFPAARRFGACVRCEGGAVNPKHEVRNNIKAQISK